MFRALAFYLREAAKTRAVGPERLNVENRIQTPDAKGQTAMALTEGLGARLI
jgi:hypothetical protein